MKSFSDAIISLTPFHPSLTRQMQDQIFDLRQGGSASGDMTASRFQCPFPECAKYYKRNGDVRKHVRRKHPSYQACKIRGCQVYSPKGDKRHLADHQFVQENQTRASSASTIPRSPPVSSSINTQGNEMGSRLPSVDGTGNSTFASPSNQIEPATASNIDPTTIEYFHSLDMPMETTPSFGPRPTGLISLPHRFIVPSQPQQYNTNTDTPTDTQEEQEPASSPATSESLENSNYAFPSYFNDSDMNWHWGPSG